MGKFCLLWKLMDRQGWPCRKSRFKDKLKVEDNLVLNTHPFFTKIVIRSHGRDDLHVMSSRHVLKCNSPALSVNFSASDDIKCSLFRISLLFFTSFLRAFANFSFLCRLSHKTVSNPYGDPRLQHPGNLQQHPGSLAYPDVDQDNEEDGHDQEEDQWWYSPVAAWRRPAQWLHPGMLQFVPMVPRQPLDPRLHKVPGHTWTEVLGAPRFNWANWIFR